MPRLEYIDNNGAKSVINLGEETSVSIGRNPGSSIHTTNPSVSRNHGRIFQKGRAWIVKDLGSSNGTYVGEGDDRIQQQQLLGDSVIRCGDFVINFFEGDSDVPDTSAAEAPKRRRRPRKTMRPDSLSMTASRLPAQESVPPAPEPAEEEPPRDSRRRRRRRAEPEPEAAAPADPPPSRRSRSRDGGSSKPDRTRIGRDREAEGGGRSSRGSSRRSEEPEPRSRRSSRRGGEERTESESRLIRQIKEQAAEIETLSTELKEHKSMVSDLELKLEENETRSTRYEVELDSITEKYVQIKDQLTLSKERLDESREEAAEKEDKIFALETRMNELDAELEGARDRSTGSSEAIANLKIKLTQKERQIEELQRQYDLQEFEFRAARDELLALQEGYNADAGDTAKLERRINQLREIIADKENVVSELRLELENKDIEIRQIRMGMGMTDLEDEKRKLLEDYYEKNREADQLRDEKVKLELDHKEAEAKNAELEAELDRRSQAMADITSHPDYKAKVRENKRLEEQVSELTGELGTATDRLSEFSAEEKKRLQGEVAFFKRKSATIDDKLAKAADRMGQLEVELEAVRTKAAEAPPPEPAGISEEELNAKLDEIRESQREDLEGVMEMFAQWRSNFSLFKTYLKEVAGAINSLSEAEIDDLPDDLQDVVKETDPAEALGSVQDLLRVVDSDATALRRGLNGFKKSLGV